MSYEPILGIDLGTTFSAMAWVDEEGHARILPNREGNLLTPSVFHFPDARTCVVGEQALRMVVADAPNVVRFVKRAIGVEGRTFTLHGQARSPQEISAFLLRKFKQDAEAALGRPVDSCVISVPAYFNAAQRGATQEAGSLAGFVVRSIVNEPTAAAIAWGVERLGGERRLLVFDLGGGTFDVTLMEMKGSTLTMLASDGNAELGGKDWDDRLVARVAARTREITGEALPDLETSQELFERCVAAKIQLSTRPRTVVPVRVGRRQVSVPITREEFEHATADLVAQCTDTCGVLLERAGLTWADVDDILPAGGSTRMPMVQEALRRASGKPIVAGLHPDECVALGAAHCAVFRHQPDHPAISAWREALAGRRPTDTEGAATEAPTTVTARPRVDSGGSVRCTVPVAVHDVATHPLGAVVLDARGEERILGILPASAPLPAEKRVRFAYAWDGMTSVKVEVTEGTGTSRAEVTVIGTVVLEGLPPRPRGTPIDVIYRYAHDGTLEVAVVDVETSAETRARIELHGQLDGDRFAEVRLRVRDVELR